MQTQFLYILWCIYIIISFVIISKKYNAYYKKSQNINDIAKNVLYEFSENQKISHYNELEIVILDKNTRKIIFNTLKSDQTFIGELTENLLKNYDEKIENVKHTFVKTYDKIHAGALTHASDDKYIAFCILLNYL